MKSLAASPCFRHLGGADLHQDLKGRPNVIEESLGGGTTGGFGFADGTDWHGFFFGPM